MVVAVPKPADVPVADAPASDSVAAALTRLQPVDAPRLLTALRFAPWALTLCAMYLLGVFGPVAAGEGATPLHLPPEAVVKGGGFMLATGVAAAAAGLFAGQLLLASIPET